jgi:hypothetical protein
VRYDAGGHSADPVDAGGLTMRKGWCGAQPAKISFSPFLVIAVLGKCKCNDGSQESSLLLM